MLNIFMVSSKNWFGFYDSTTDLKKSQFKEFVFFISFTNYLELKKQMQTLSSFKGE